MAAIGLRRVPVLWQTALKSSRQNLYMGCGHHNLLNYHLQLSANARTYMVLGSYQGCSAVMPGRPTPHSVQSGSSLFCNKNQNKVHHVSAAVATSCHVRVADDRRKVSLTGLKEYELRFNATWLRHNCHCDACRQPHSGQVLIEPSKLRPLYTIRDASLQGSDLVVTWQEEDHVGKIPITLLESCDFSENARQLASQERIPRVCKGWLPTCDYDDVKSSPQGLWSWVSQLNDYGLCLLKGVPTDTGSVKQTAELIWPIQRTIYGEIFDVISTPKPINVAYTNSYLGFHMDLVYYESAPGIQFLLCQQFDACVEGGQSLFVDAWDVAEDMRRLYPGEFDTLTRLPATFQKIHYDREHPVHMRYRQPHIVLGSNNKITGLNWAPAFEGPLELSEEEIEPYYKAYHRFAQMLEESETKMEFHLEPGQLIAFNNRRILHARREFILNGGMRALEGCYMNIDEFKSRVEVLSRQCGDFRPAKHVFNQCLV